MPFHRKRRVPKLAICLIMLPMNLRLLAFGALLAGTCVVPALWRTDTPVHLVQARELVQNLQGASLNTYGGGHRAIDWDARPCSARTVCSSFATLLLEHSYAWPQGFVKKWLGHSDPLAADYYDAITGHNGFKQIVHVSRLQHGDLLAIRYTDHHVSRNGVEDTGHVMVVDEVLAAGKPKPPLQPGTKQVFVAVIDSSASGHGPSDTRHVGKGKFTGGIGRGVMRIYADGEDHIAGYAWSDEKRSEFYAAPDRILVAGRLDPGRLPGR